MRRTLMHRDVELLDFEIDPVTGDACVLDESEAGHRLLVAAGTDWNKTLSRLLRSRAISCFREDLPRILEAFRARSRFELALMGRGLSLADLFWYRAPNSTDRWADINFSTNGWDLSFRAAVMSHDYSGLAKCSLDVPDVTTPGRAVKAWERIDDGVFLVKAARRPDGADAQGAKLCSDLCAALLDESSYVPASIVERCGWTCSASPLMLSCDEELVNGYWLRAVPAAPGAPIVPSAPDVPANREAGDTELFQKWDNLIRSYTAAGIAHASTHVAKMAACSCLALLADFHPGNFGVIRNAETGALRPAPFFDYDGAFGFPADLRELAALCENPIYAMMVCANTFSGVDPSWDWSWYDPQVLEGFEDCIMDTFEPYQSLPSNFSELVADLFAMQRDFVTRMASTHKRA